MAIAAAAVAPFFHGNGCFLTFALLPAFRESALRKQVASLAAWQLALMLTGIVCAAGSMSAAGGIALGSQGLLGRFLEAPGEAALQIVKGTGQCLLNPVVNTDVEALGLGAAALLLPFLLFVRRPARPELQRLDAASVSCVLYGLLAIFWQMERLGLGAEAAVARPLSLEIGRAHV